MSRDFSKVSSTIWNSKRFHSLDDVAKILFIYFLTSPHGNNVGLYACRFGYIKLDTSLTEDQINQAIAILQENDMVHYDENEEFVLVTNWLRFNKPANPNGTKGMIKEIDKCPDGYLKKRALNLLCQNVSQHKFPEKMHKYCMDQINRLSQFQASVKKPVGQIIEAPDTMPLLSGELDETDHIYQRFETWWQSYPTCGRVKGSKAKAKKLYIALCGDGWTPEKIDYQTALYASYIAGTGQLNMDAARYLNPKNDHIQNSWTLPDGVKRNDITEEEMLEKLECM